MNDIQRDDHIPFVNGKEDCELVTEFYSTSTLARMSLDRYDELRPLLPASLRIWVDPTVDSFHRNFSDVKNVSWLKMVRECDGYQQLADHEHFTKPDRGAVQSFVDCVMTNCASRGPLAITVPQLPLTNGSARNKINRVLAKATSKWKKTAGYKGVLIFPVIVTHQRQVNLKTARTKKLSSIRACFEDSEASATWTVDSSLSDQEASPTFRNTRFPGIIAFQEELIAAIGENQMTICGPYWGMNLVLWARGLCKRPAIGVGKAFQYHVAGGQASKPKTRIAIPPLRRWAQVGGQFRDWLDEAMKKLPPRSKELAQFSEIKNNLSRLSVAPAARRQIAKYYKEWFDTLASNPPEGRGLAAYQDLSAAYILGRTLPALPAVEGTARRPERVAEYFMLNCL